ncbi:septum formation family protein [Verrucosispora sp. TAA-831]|uniref:septum formation family protein n=1 Tax=Verrucosispora sp. TAA-831 TaxID=3422227 RepID=UPI003D6EDC36
MRRWWIGVALGAVTLALAACSTRPAGVDGDLVDDWPVMAAPEVFTPAAQTCHPQPQDVGYLSGYAPVDCAQPHRAETLHVGRLTEAGGTTPPEEGSTAMRTAYRECDRAVRGVLGGDWRTARIGLTVVLPSPRAWTGGARWFRCDAHETDALDTPTPVRRTASLAGTLDGSSSLRHRCFRAETKGDEVTEMVAVKCSARHHAEFVGVWKSPAKSYAAFEKDTARAHRGCLSLIATYAKVPDDGNMQYRAGTVYYHPSEAEWRNGERGVQCFLWLNDRTLTKSVKGGGSRALPIG